MRSSLPWLLAVALLLMSCGGDSGETTSTTAAPVTTVTSAEPSTTRPADSTTSTASTTTTTTDPYSFDIVVAGSTVTGGGRLTVPLGETVTLRVTAETADEVHIHGYDLFLDLEPGVTAELSFTADIPGVVEIELEGSGLLLASLETG